MRRSLCIILPSMGLCLWPCNSTLYLLCLFCSPPPPPPPPSHLVCVCVYTCRFASCFRSAAIARQSAFLAAAVVYVAQSNSPYAGGGVRGRVLGQLHVRWQQEGMLCVVWSDLAFKEKGEGCCCRYRGMDGALRIPQVSWKMYIHETLSICEGYMCIIRAAGTFDMRASLRGLQIICFVALEGNSLQSLLSDMSLPGIEVHMSRPTGKGV